MAEALQPEDEDVHSDSTEYYTSSEEDDDSESLNTGSVKELTNCGNTYHSVFVDTIKHAIEDDQLITSNCGKEVLQVLKRVKVNSDSLPTREIIATICTRVQSCISKGDRCKLPSSIASRIWPAFHEMRLSTDLHYLWKTHLLDTLGCHVSEMTTLLALQVVLNRLIKQMIGMKRGENQGTSMQSPPVEMSEREIKVVHYMSGYVVRKMMKKYAKKSPKDETEKKRRLLVSVLKGMTVGRVDVDAECSDINDESEWTELIDRGGLTYVKPEVNSNIVSNARYCYAYAYTLDPIKLVSMSTLLILQLPLYKFNLYLQDYYKVVQFRPQYHNTTVGIYTMLTITLLYIYTMC